MKGADRVAQKIIDELGITWGETSKDGVFTLEAARCLGTCGLAPVVMIDDEIHGDVTPDQVPALLEKYLKKAKGTGLAHGHAQSCVYRVAGPLAARVVVRPQTRRASPPLVRL